MKLSTIIVAAFVTLASAQQHSASASASASSSVSASVGSTLPSSSASAVSSAAQPSSSSTSGSGTGTGTGTGAGGAIISVTAPLQGASYKAGDKAIISWINPSVQTISQIVLAKGGSNSLQPVSTIATNVAANTGSYTWNIPADTPPGSDYAFEFGTSPNLAFTGQFSITAGGNAPAVAPSGPTTVTSGTNSSSSIPSSGGSLSSGAGSQPSSSSSSSDAITLGPSMIVFGTAMVAVVYPFF